MILDLINQSNDIKKVSPEDYDKLASELREYIVKYVGVNGGHLSSSLGVIELTIALHLVFNLPEDKIIWDVGHQAYAHKILTGRKEQFKTLRKEGSISGFPNIEESDCDAFGTGHASTSLSAALGLIKARELSGENNSIISVLGDGALSGGMAFEALNNASDVNSNMIIILNDNDMSISKSVGGMSKMLTGIRTGRKYNKLKNNVKTTLEKIPGCGDGIVSRIHKTKSSIKQFFVPGMLFEDMGITYLGPVDGHDINKLVNILNQAKKVNHAVLIHIHTQKGRGYSFAEKNPSFYHGIAPFNVETGKLINQESVRTYSDVLSSFLIKNAKEDNKIVAITAAMADGTGLDRFAKKYPDRFVDVGIAEEHAITYAAGLATSGYKPYVAIYSSFLQRSFDQILHDVCIQKLPVRMIVERAGIVGNDGITHQGIFDLSYLNIIPNMTILAPKNRFEFKDMLDFSMNFDGPIAIRVPRGKASDVYGDIRTPISYGKCEILEDGRDVAILAVGSQVETAKEVSRLLANRGINPTVVNSRFVKPIDENMISFLAKGHKLIVTIEENVSAGGFGETVLDFINVNNIKTKVLNISLGDAFVEHGSVDYLLDKYGLSAQGIVDKILKRIKK